ncbi:MAG: hypothetical protein HY874_04455 [Chloroflexi bacterium]|nr:hypothetical protein [Chloroflexota bacterium]
MVEFTPRHVLRFRECIPQRLALDIPRYIWSATSEAFLRGGALPPFAARDLFPYDRRSLVETGLLTAARKYGDLGIGADEVKNKTLNASHVEIYAQEVVLIAAAVEGRAQLPREAEFRNSLLEDPQIAFPDPEMSSAKPTSNVLVGVILYGPSSHYPRAKTEARPGFVEVRFPVAGWARWAEGSIDLLDELEQYERGKNSSNDGPQLQADEGTG